VLSLFVTLILLWVFRKPIYIGVFSTPGWSDLFSSPEYINDGTVAIFVAILLFIVPSSKKSEGLITWEVLPKIPWGIVLLFGGGFALATGFKDTGLSHYIGEELKALEDYSPFSLSLIVTTTMTFLTEFTSNTATTEMLLPIIIDLSGSIHINPLFLMIPLTLAASFAFMFPVATPPNAVVFGSGKLKITDMAKAGIIVNSIGIIFVVVFSYFWGGIIFDIDPTIYPDWALHLK
ncbi:SLC13 family permease, partial [Cyclobacteriaceae bacterium]|nr:SLC13 family permease [Cyclobacteriaceae bacterium]